MAAARKNHLNGGVPAAVTLLAIAVVLSIVTTSVLANDPDMLQDLCVADTAGVKVNGFTCKPMSNVTASDFFTSKISKPAPTNTTMGSAVTGANVDQIPGLNTLGISMGRIDYAPNGLNPPHIHPRATEMVFLLYGELDVGFITTGNVHIAKRIKTGETFVFPRGLVHYQKNPSKDKPAAVVTAFNSQLAGTQSIAAALFTATPAVPEGVLMKAFQLDAMEVNKIKTKLSPKKK